MIRKLIAIVALTISSLSAPLAAPAATPRQFHAEHARMEQRAAMREAQMRRDRDRRTVARPTSAAHAPVSWLAPRSAV